MNPILKGTPEYPWPTVDIDIPLLLTLSARTTREGNQYRLGGKAPSLDADSSVVARIGIDCSGFVRWILYRATNNRLVIPDGSWYQRDWVEGVGFKESTVFAATLRDNRIRLAYMKPLTPKGIGHIALVHNALTIESSSKRGPGRRPWDGNGWQRRCKLWVLK